MILNKKLIQKLFLLSILSGIFVSAHASDDPDTSTTIVTNDSKQPWTLLFSVSSDNGSYLERMSECLNGVPCTISPGERKTIYYAVQSEKLNGTVTITDNLQPAQQKAFVISYFASSFFHSLIPFTSRSTLWIDSSTDSAGNAISFNSPYGGYITIKCDDWHC